PPAHVTPTPAVTPICDPRPLGSSRPFPRPAPDRRGPEAATPRREEARRTHRDVVSFARRGGRLTPSRQAAWDRLADDYVLDPPRGERDTLPGEGAWVDLEELFGRRADRKSVV